MNPITEENRIEKYRTAAAEIRALYVSENLTKIVGSIYDKYAFTQPFKILSDIVGDTILGFTKISDMPRLFQQKLGVSADESQRMVSQLIEILGPVVEREATEASAKKEEMGKLADTFAKPEGLTTPLSGATPVVEVVEPIRTMAQDMNRVHGYGAYREEEDKKESTESIASSQTEIIPKKPEGV